MFLTLKCLVGIKIVPFAYDSRATAYVGTAAIAGDSLISLSVLTLSLLSILTSFGLPGINTFSSITTISLLATSGFISITWIIMAARAEGQLTMLVKSYVGKALFDNYDYFSKRSIQNTSHMPTYIDIADIYK